MKRSFASMSLASAGTISPAERRMMSPATASSSGISCLFQSCLSTVQVTVIIASSLSAASPERDSCTKRRMPEMPTIVIMMTTVSTSASSGIPCMTGIRMSVTADTAARQSRIAVKGLIKAPANRCASDFFLLRVTLLAP